MVASLTTGDVRYAEIAFVALVFSSLSKIESKINDIKSQLDRLEGRK